MEDKSAHIRVIHEISVLPFVDGSFFVCWRLPWFPIGAPEFENIRDMLTSPSNMMQLAPSSRSLQL
jgi:hypothetical protein